jgi:hypothetical protein
LPGGSTSPGTDTSAEGVPNRSGLPRKILSHWYTLAFSILPEASRLEAFDDFLSTMIGVYLMG